MSLITELVSRQSLRRSATSPAPASRRGWLAAALLLVGTGWGSNQITPMLLVYQRTLSLSTGTVEGMFGVYALGLVPGLLVVGPISDRRGRRVVAIPTAAVSLVASAVLILGRGGPDILFVGRFLAGVSSGAAFGAGTAWVRELSRRPYGEADDHTAARRAAIAMTLGFGVGPLVAGILAQWAPAPTVVPYLPHLLLMAIALSWVRSAPETVSRSARTSTRPARDPEARRRFLRLVAPMAPWAFAAPAIAMALLPSVVGADRAPHGVALVAAVATLCALTGVAVQPVARRLDARLGRGAAARAGLSMMVLALGASAAVAALQDLWLLLPASLMFGAAYGLCLVAGLVEVQRLAQPGDLARWTAWYYALTYVGFAAPFVLALAAHAAGYPVLLAALAALALLTEILIALLGRGLGARGAGRGR